MNPARGVGHGKLILLGEHAVVHGQPAIALTLREGVRVRVRAREPGAPASETEELRGAVAAATAALGLDEERAFEVSVEGELPVAVGLGSSAALAVGLVRAIAAHEGRRLDRETTARLANEVEKIFHGTPSGIDATAASQEGLIWFEAGRPPRWERLDVVVPALVVALSGARHHTGETVGGLSERAGRHPEVYRPIFAAIGELVRAGRTALEQRDWPLLGEIMTMDHALLRGCGVSTPALDRLVEDARDAGALGAKLTGGGGGGAIVALPADSPETLVANLRERGWTAFVA